MITKNEISSLNLSPTKKDFVQIWNELIEVASKITDMFFKPSILICFEDDEGNGSGRSIPGFDLHEALVKSSNYLERYGGHEMAVGVSLKKDMYN